MIRSVGPKRMPNPHQRQDNRLAPDALVNPLSCFGEFVIFGEAPPSSVIFLRAGIVYLLLGLTATPVWTIV